MLYSETIWPSLLNIGVMLAAGLLGVFGLVAYATRPGARQRALPRGTKRVTDADLKEASDRAWREETARKVVAMSGRAR